MVISSPWKYYSVSINDSCTMSTMLDALLNVSRPLPEASPALKHTILVSYLCTFVFGMAGNGLVIYIIAYYKSVRTKSVANYYIWNLSFADLFFILTLPLFCYATFTSHWPFGWFVCKLSYAIRETNRYASVFTLVALSLDRYLASFYNLGYLRTLLVGKIVCSVIWVICICLSIPYWLYARVVVNKENNTSCRFLWPESQQFTYFTMWAIFQLLTALLLPFTCIIASYVLLARRLRRIRRRRRSESHILRPSKKMTRTVLVIVVLFLICQAPFHAVQFISVSKVAKANTMEQQGVRYVPDSAEFNTFVYLNGLAQILVFLSSCCNPIIYGLLNDNYMKLYRVVLCRCCQQRGLEETGSCDSDQREDPSPSHLTYRFEITFHLPCAGIPHHIRRKHTAPSTEQLELEEKNTVQLLGNAASSLEARGSEHDDMEHFTFG